MNNPDNGQRNSGGPSRDIKQKKKKHIKVCGMRNIDNIRRVLDLGIHYIGFIFYEKSPRNIDVKAEKELLGAMPDLPFLSLRNNVQKIGVFVDAEKELVLEKVHQLELDYVQLHGRESVFYCSWLKKKGVKIIKAFSIDERFRFTNTDFYQFDCDYFLFDTKGENKGGNGTKFNWELLEKYDGGTPFFLSGGIGESDAKAIRELNFPKLHSVDINSKFEIEPALKDENALERFINVYHERAHV